MGSLSRRHFVRGLLAAGAAGVTSQLWMPGSAWGQPVAPAFPTIFIRLRGGWDPVQHFSARIGLANRNVTASQMKTTRAGVVYYAPIGDMLSAHVEDAVVIRNVLMPETDHRVGANILWYGALSGQTTRAPWTNYLASALLERASVASPNLTAYWTYDSNGGLNDFINHNNLSPNPLGAAQRLLSLDGFARSLDVTEGLPTAARQQRVYEYLKGFDGSIYNQKVQAKLLDTYGKATQQANGLVMRPPVKLWPPDEATMKAFAATPAELSAIGYGGIPAFKAMCLFAYQAVRNQVSHVISFDSDVALSSGTDYDSHRDNVNGQLAAAQHHLPPIAQLLSALKATPSPVVAGKTLFDTTHVVIASEMGRSPNAEGELGTFHWGWQHVLLFGGNFKRGFAFGEMSPQLTGVAANFDTGVIGGNTNPSFMNVVTTVLKANGVDPKGYDPAPPINAVLST